jgi:hypothetical protein
LRVCGKGRERRICRYKGESNRKMKKSTYRRNSYIVLFAKYYYDNQVKCYDVVGHVEPRTLFKVLLGLRKAKTSLERLKYRWK